MEGARQACPRCQGLLVELPCWEREWVQIAQHRLAPLYLWRCVNCGHREDPTMVANRAGGTVPGRVRTRRPRVARVRPQISWMEMRQVLWDRRRRNAPVRSDEIWQQVQTEVAATMKVA